jgi:hypothetical protein
MLGFWSDWWWAICLFVLIAGTGGLSFTRRKED